MSEVKIQNIEDLTGVGPAIAEKLEKQDIVLWKR